MNLGHVDGRDVDGWDVELRYIDGWYVNGWHIDGRHMDLRPRTARRGYIASLSKILLCTLHLSPLLPPFFLLRPSSLMLRPSAISPGLLLLSLQLAPLLRQSLDLCAKSSLIGTILQLPRLASFEFGFELLDFGFRAHLLRVRCPGFEARDVEGDLLIFDFIITWERTDRG